MSNYIPVETPGGIIWVEISAKEDVNILELTAFQDRAYESFRDTANALKANAQYLKELILELQPDGVEISFGIKVGVEGGNTFFGLAKATSEANYDVKITWGKT